MKPFNSEHLDKWNWCEIDSFILSYRKIRSV